MRQPWKLWVLGGVAVVLLVTVGAPFVYIHFIEGKPPAPLSLSNSPATTAGSTATTAGSTVGSGQPTTAVPSGTSPALDGTWKIGSGSQAGYRIKESLFGQSNTAVGRTSAVTGTIVIAGSAVTTGTFSVDMTTVSSDRSQRDGQFQGRIMDTSTYPTATFTLTAPIQLGNVPGDGVVVTKSATGNLNMHGVTKSVSFQVTAKRSGASVQASGSIPIVFADWNISNPSGGPATTEDHGILEFLLNFTHG